MMSFDAAVAVVARRDDGVSLGGSHLLGLDLDALHTGELPGRSAVDHAAASGTAVVVLVARIHVAEVLAQRVDHVAQLFVQAATAHDVARVLHGDRFLDLALDLEPSALDQVVVELHRMDHGNGRLLPRQPLGSVVHRAAVGVAALTHDDPFDSQLGRSLPMRPFHLGP